MSNETAQEESNDSEVSEKQTDNSQASAIDKFTDFLEPVKQEEVKESSEEKSTSEDEIKKETENQSVKEEEKQPDPDEFDLKLLDTEIKRHNEVVKIKDFLKNATPEEIKENFQKALHFDRENKEIKNYLVKEKTKIEEKERGLDLVLMRNMAYEADKPLKTKEDFINDMRFDSEDEAEKAFNDYEKELSESVGTIKQHREYATMQNTNNVERFAEKYPDVDIPGLLESITPMLNASVGAGTVPFPENTLEVAYKGLNFDKLVKAEVDKAIENERKLIYKEIKKNGSSPKLPASSKTSKERIANLERSPIDNEFEDAWVI